MRSVMCQGKEKTTVRVPALLIALQMAAVLALHLAACGGRQWTAPPGFPELSAPWAQLVYQIPASSEGVLLTSLDRPLAASPGIFLADLLGARVLSRLASDALGMDIGSNEAMGQLGLDPLGGLALFLYRDCWVALADLSSPLAMRRALDAMRLRNSDLESEWRSVGDEDVLTLWIPDGVVSSPRFHAMVTGRQAIVLWDLASDPVVTLADELLLTVRDGAWGESILFKPDLAEAVVRFGGDTQALYAFDTSALSADRPWQRRLHDGLGFFGPSPPAARCREVESQIDRVIPGFSGAIRRLLEPLEGGVGTREISILRLQLAQSALGQTRGLVPAERLDGALIEEGAAASLLVQVQPKAFVSVFGGFSDVADCGGITGWTGMLGQVAEALEGFPELTDNLNGLVAAVLLDLRNLSQIPYPDLFVAIGSVEPSRLSRVIHEAFQAELGLSGSAETVGDLRAVHYRVALLYRLTVYQASRALGLSLGRVPVQWVRSLLSATDRPAETFINLFLDGQRLRQAVGAMVEVAQGDPAIVRSTEVPLRALQVPLETLSDLIWMRVTARIGEGCLEVESTSVRAEP